jgi:hypothetical protein
VALLRTLGRALGTNLPCRFTRLAAWGLIPKAYRQPHDTTTSAMLHNNRPHDDNTIAKSLEYLEICPYGYHDLYANIDQLKVLGFWFVVGVWSCMRSLMMFPIGKVHN